MPQPETAGLYQRALVWAATSWDDYAQRKRSATFVEVPCQWNDQATQGTDNNGNNVALQATVRTNIDIPPGSMVWKGSTGALARALQRSVSPTDVPTSDLFEVITVNGALDAKGRATARIYGLQRLGDFVRPASS